MSRPVGRAPARPAYSSAPHGRRPPAQRRPSDDDDESENSEDEETAVGTDLSQLPPAPSHGNRAGFASNPVSEQVYFDREAAPAATPKPADRATPSAAPPGRQRALPARAPPRANTTPVQQPPPSFRQPPQPPAMQRPQQQWRPARAQTYAPPSAYRQYPEGGDNSDSDTIVAEPDRHQQPPPLLPPAHFRRAPAPLSSQLLTAPSGPRQPYTYTGSTYPAQPRVPTSRPPAHGYSSFEEEPEEGIDSDDDAFTAVGTGVATDLSLEEDLGQQPTHLQQQQQQRTLTYPAARAGPPTRSFDFGRMPVVSAAPPTRMMMMMQQQQQQYQYAHQATTRSGMGPASLSSVYRPPSPLSDFSASLNQGMPPLTTMSAPPSYAESALSTFTLSSSATSAPPPAQPSPSPPPTADSAIEQSMMTLLKEMNFSLALKDLHDHFGLGVQKTLVAEDGRGHAYVKVHCKRLPKADQVEREPHLRKHWVSLTATRWDFRTSSEHRVTVVWKTTAVGAYESAAR